LTSQIGPRCVGAGDGRVQIQDVLQYAHAATGEKGRPLGVVHRAIDLSHIFMDWEGQVQVSDFGLARSSSQVRDPKWPGLKVQT
jgi:serine/threonine protein kinase